jgi:hypothetical protein
MTAADTPARMEHAPIGRLVLATSGVAIVVGSGLSLDLGVVLCVVGLAS